ncbi:RDD family protein [Parapedobacter sp. ISTM3]|uniref:RDD family protein n=1 Tax=Parapedobacter sp. ISTM3 TaxID=2800130 RepID=UPI0019089DB3|nr:RDD family protein [Parapedobacter sp. ISTM3]MBK1438738.1 RDD family protein [Parapedobacter sp. ISTM3]
MDTLSGQYEVVIHGKPQGPFTLDELRGMNLRPTDFVKPAGHPEFKELREFAELSKLLGVKHQTTQPQYFASLDMRLLSTAIDYFIAFCIYAVLAAIYLGGTANAKESVPTLLVGLILVPVFKFVLCVITEGSQKHASIGKMLIGIKVTDEQGRPIGYGKALLRNLAKIVGVVTLGIGFFTGFLDRRQQCLHDKIAGTLVIKDRLI